MKKARVLPTASVAQFAVIQASHAETFILHCSFDFFGSGDHIEGEYAVDTTSATVTDVSNKMAATITDQAIRFTKVMAQSKYDFMINRYDGRAAIGNGQLLAQGNCSKAAKQF